VRCDLFYQYFYVYILLLYIYYAKAFMSLFFGLFRIFDCPRRIQSVRCNLSAIPTSAIGRFIAGLIIGRSCRSPSDMFEYPKAVQYHAILLRLQLVKSVVSSLVCRPIDWPTTSLLFSFRCVRVSENSTISHNFSTTSTCEIDDLLDNRFSDYIILVLLQIYFSIRKQYNVTQFFYDFNL